METVNLYREPKLKNATLVAAWPGMGGVAIIAARYLKEKLQAEEFGRIEPYDFFEPNVVTIQGNVIEEPDLPLSRFYLWKKKGGNDLIIFMGEAQPAVGGYRLANLILDIAEKFKAKRVYTFAAAPSHIYHAAKPRVLGATTHPKLTPKLKEYGATPMKTGTISGLNGLLLGVAKKRKMDGICLLGEIPVYATQIANPKASKAVLEVVTKLLALEIDMTEIDEWAAEVDQQMEANVERLRQSPGEEARKLVDYFERLQQASAGEAEIREPPEIKTSDLLKEIEQFLKREREQKEGN